MLPTLLLALWAASVRSPRCHAESISVAADGRIFRERLSALETAAGQSSQPPSLSLQSLCRGLTRSQAARLFYQVCGAQLPDASICLPLPTIGAIAAS